MNNLKKILLASVALLVVTGCGSEQTLTCEKEDTELGSKIVVTNKFSEDKLEEMTMLTSMDLQGGTLPTDEDLESFCATSEGVEGTYCDASMDGDILKLNLKLKMNELSDDAKADLGYDGETYDSLKKELESEGYTCK